MGFKTDSRKKTFFWERVLKPTKEEEISDEMVMEEEIQEEIAQDGFFMGGGASDGGGSGGIPGLDDGDDNNKEKERNERDLRNRSTNVCLEDLQSEFQETIMNEENCFSQGSTQNLPELRPGPRIFRFFRPGVLLRPVLVRRSLFQR